MAIRLSDYNFNPKCFIPISPIVKLTSILTKGSTCRNIPKPCKQVVKYNIPVFISIGQNYVTAFYVSEYCFASL